MYNHYSIVERSIVMRKFYVQPKAELLSLTSLEDFLLLSPDLDEEDDNEMGGSSGTIQPDRPGIWG